MTTGPRVAVGMTINLGNYESLRVDVQGAEFETRLSVLEEVDAVLATIQGRADKPTAEIIAQFRRGRLGRERLLPAEPKAPKARGEKEPWIPKITKGELPPDSEKIWVGKADPTAVVRFDEQRPPTTEEQAKEAIARCVKPPAPAPDPAPSAPPKTEASAPAERPAAPQPAASAPDGEVCERCGAAVTKSQAKLSQLFMNKTLCKTCMDSNGGAG